MRGRDHNVLSGPLAIVLTIVGIAIQSGEPGTNASGAEIASYFTDHKTQVTVSTILFGISAALLVLFGARLRERWREQAKVVEKRGTDGSGATWLIPSAGAGAPKLGLRSVSGQRMDSGLKGAATRLHNSGYWSYSRPGRDAHQGAARPACVR